jgi:MFS family permease
MQGLVLGIYGMGNIGSAIAAYAAPAIAAFYGWRWAFWAFIYRSRPWRLSSGSSGATPHQRGRGLR